MTELDNSAGRRADAVRSIHGDIRARTTLLVADCCAPK